MNTIKDLTAARDDHARAARQLLASMGSSRWGANERMKYDRHVGEADRLQAQIDNFTKYTSEAEDVGALFALDTYLRKSENQLSSLDANRIYATMSTTTGSEGGYATPTSVSQTLVDQIKGYGFMRQVAQQLTTSTGENLSYPTSDGTAEVGELLVQNAPATSADPTFGTAPIPVYRFSSKAFTVPFELLQDSRIDIIGFVLKRARDRIGRAQNSYFTTGTGSSQPNGLVTAATVGKTGTTGQTATVIYDDVVDLVDSVNVAHLGVPSKAGGNDDAAPGWMFAQATRKVIRKIKDSNGRPIWVPAYGKEPAQLLDFPVYMNNDMPTPAANAKSIAFGNLASYSIRDVLDVRLLRFDDSAYALRGQVGFLGTARAGGTLLDSGAVKLYQHSAT